MSETNERSVGSRGSVGEPLAYAVMQPDAYVVVHTRLAASVMLDTCGGGEVVPLYRHTQPTLTEAEREAVDSAAHAAAQLYVGPEGVRIAATLRGLLERLAH